MTEKLYTRPFIGLISTNFLYWIGVYLYIPVLPLYFYTQGMNSREIGMIVGSFSLGSVLFRYLGGKAADRYGSVPVIVTGLLITGIAIGGFWTAASLPLLILLRFFHGMGSALYSSAAVTMVTLLQSGKQTKQGVSLYTLCSMVGIGIATSTAGWLFEQWDFHGIVFISGAATWGCLLLIPKKSMHRHRLKVNDEPVSLGRVLFDRMIYLPAFNQFAVYICYASVMTYLPLMAAERDAALELGWFYISYTISVVASRFLAGKIGNRVDQRAVSTFLLAVLAGILLLPAFSQAWYSLLVTGIGLGLGVGLATPTLIGMITDHVSIKIRGAALGFFATAIDLGMGAGSLLPGIVVPFLGYSGIFVMVSLGTLMVCLAYHRGIYSQDRKAIQEKTE